MERAFPPLAMKKVSIKHLQLFEDRSDVACRVVIKTIGSQVEGMRGGHGTRMEAAAMGGGIFALRRAQYELKNSVKQS